MNAFQYIHESTMELDAVAKAKWHREVIAQLQLDNNLLNAMVYADTPPEQVTEQKSVIEEIATYFEETKQDAKNIMEATTQFWGSVIQDEQLEQLTKKLQEAENQLEMLKTTLKTMPPLVSITWSAELKEIQ